GRARFYRGKPGDGNHLLHHREKPIASGADGFLRLSPVDFALRIHVSVSRYATLGPNGRRNVSSHPFSPHRPRHSLKRECHGRKPTFPSCTKSRCGGFDSGTARSF